LPPEPSKLIIHTDGGSRSNPGPAGSAYVFSDESGNIIEAKGFFIGKATNNQAEYTAVIKALQSARQFSKARITLYSDSELLVKQVNGEYKVKNENIRPLFDQLIELLRDFHNCRFVHLRRHNNKHADKLVNMALDRQQDVIEKMAENLSAQSKPVRLGVLISGGGTTLVNLLKYIKAGKLNADIPLVISSRSTVKGVERAQKAGLNVKIIRKKDNPDIDALSRKIESELNAAKVDLVIQAGWLCLWKIPADYKNRVMNIHPALLPSFGGQGMWGHHVHEAVLKTGVKVSGCTVHFCTNEYDQGPIIVQRTCPVNDDDTPESLAERVFEQECIAYPEAINLFAQNKLIVRQGRVFIKS